MFSDYSVQIYGIRFDKTKNKRLNDKLAAKPLNYTSEHSVSLASTVSGKAAEASLSKIFSSS